jgi:S1-C subfamily serine protease
VSDTRPPSRILVAIDGSGPADRALRVAAGLARLTGTTIVVMHVRAGERVVVLSGESVRAGGDIIVAIDGHPVTSGGDLRAYIENSKRPGEAVTLTLLRADQRLELQVLLQERPGQPGCRP